MGTGSGARILSMIGLALRTHRRMWYRLVPFVALLILALVGGFVATLVLAAPTGRALATAAAEGTPVATWRVLLSTGWSLVPVAMMALAGVLYIGMTAHYADGVLTRRATRSVAAARSTLRRAPRTAAVMAIHLTGVVAAFVAAPLVSLAAVAGLLAAPLARRARPRLRWPATRTLLVLAVPFALAGMLAVRWSLALPEALLADANWRRALRASWQHTTGHVRTVSALLLVAVVVAWAGMVALQWLGTSSGDPGLAALLDTLATLLVAPLPIVAVLVLYRTFGADLPPPDTAVDVSPLPVMPVVLVLSLTVNLLGPLPPAHAVEPAQDDDSKTDTTVEVTDDSVRTGTYGDAHTFTGSVDPSDASGTVTLLWADDSGETEEVRHAVAEVDDGSFAISTDRIPAPSEEVRVRYEGDDTHNSSESDWIDVDIGKRGVLLEYSCTLSNGTTPCDDREIQVGQEVRLGARLTDFDGAPLSVLTEADMGFSLQVTDDGGTAGSIDLGTAPVVSSEAEYAHTFVQPHARATFAASLFDDPNYETMGNEYNASWEVTRARSTVEIDAPSTFEFGQSREVRAAVTTSTGVPADGTVSFRVTERPVAGAQDLPVIDGVVSADFCAGPRRVGGDLLCEHEPRLPFRAPDDDPIRLYASYEGGTHTRDADIAAQDISVRERAPDPDPDPGPSFLNARVSAALADGEPAEVTRDVPGDATGVVRVHYLPGMRALCEADVQDLSCSDTFESQSDSMTQELLVYYSGDADYLPTEEVIEASLDRCRAFTLRTAGASGLDNSPVDGGTATAVTEPTCDDDHRYHVGQQLRLRADPREGHVFTGWQFLDENSVWRDHSDDRSIRWDFTEDPLTHEVRATFDLACHEVRPSIAGNGRVAVFGDHTCALPDGSEGYRHGSEVSLWPHGEHNDRTSEDDVPYEFVRLPDGAETVTADGQPDHALAVINGDEYPAVEFGPVCRTVATPAHRTGQAEVLTSPNCHSPAGAGYERGSTVTVAATPADEDDVLTHWVVDGEEAPDLGTDVETTVTVGADPTTSVEPRFSACHPIDVTIDGDGDPTQMAALGGEVTIRPGPNCPDGSERWLDGSAVTLLPRQSSNADLSVTFADWTDDERMDGIESTIQEDEPKFHWSNPRGTRHFPDLDRPIDTTLGFFADEACSELTVLGPEEITFPDSGCGDGYYFDQAKWDLQRFEQRRPWVRDEDPDSERLDIDSGYYDHTILEGVVDSALHGYGYARQYRDGSASITTDVECADGSCDIPVRGDVRLSLELCQRLDPTVSITVEGDEDERVYDSIPGLADFDWIVSEAGANCGPALTEVDPTLWYAGTDVTLRTRAPAVGLEFLGWGDVDQETGIELFLQDVRYDPVGVMVETVDTTPTFGAEVRYRAHCAPLTTGTGVSVIAPEPNCPDGEDYLLGTIVSVAAENSVGGDGFSEFDGGVIPGTTVEGEDGRPHAQALIDGPTRVTASYPSPWDVMATAAALTGKLLVGVTALAASAGLGVACPPCGAALAVLTTTAVLTSFIPGVGGDALAALDFVNPMSVVSCATEWGFGSGTSNSTEAEDGAVDLASTAVDSVKFVYESATDGTKSARDSFIEGARTSDAAAKAGATVTFVTGLYENRVHEFDTSYRDVNDLRDTAGWNDCLSERYRLAN